MKVKLCWIFSAYCLLCLHSNALCANAAIDQFLAQAGASMQALPPAAAGFEASWIGESELRYSGNEADDQSLALRFQPRFKSERRAQDRINELLHRQNTIYADAQLASALKQRYLLLLELIEISSELQFQQQRHRLDADALKLIRGLVGAEAIDAADLQAVELEYHDSGQQITLLKNRRQRLLQAIDPSRVEELEEFLQGWPEHVAGWESFFRLNSKLLRLDKSNRLELGGDRLAFELAQQKLKLARSESRSWLKFVELKLDYRADGEQETTLGFAIPLGSDNAGMFQRASAVTRANLELQSGLEQLSDAIRRNRSDLDWYREQEMAMIKTRELLAQQFARLAAADQPRIRLQLRREMQNQERMIQRNHLRALRDFIELLHSAGYLGRKPLSNWLLRQQPRL